MVFGLLILVRLVLVLVVWLVVLELLFVVLCLVCGVMSLLAGIAYVEAWGSWSALCLVVVCWRLCLVILVAG